MLKRMYPAYSPDGTGGGESTTTETKTDGAVATDGAAAVDTQPKTLDEILKSSAEMQGEFDRRVAKALETNRPKVAQEIEAGIKKRAEEEKRLAKLSEEEKTKEIIRQANERADKAESERAAMLLKAETTSILVSKNINPAFAEYLAADNADNTMAKITAFEKLLSSEISKTVAAKLPGYTPESSKENDPNKMDYAQYKAYRNTQMKG